ncbi:MAG: branched-chain amino acid ABC transporter substrate-binding protein [Rhizobiales bacterium]|nr:branched-chain amino acid ABC transporter substrate-binding protein [Hyphomicrobiales bacterium]
MNRFFLILASGLVALQLGTGPAAAEILIATAGPMSGPNAAFGEQLKRGAQAAVDDINSTGGIKGERLVLQLGDDGCDPKKAVDVATAFVAAGVKFVDGHFCSGSSIPAAKVYAAAGILEISPASSNPKFTDEGPWNVLRVVNRDDAQGSFAAAYIAARYRDKRIALLNDKSPAGAALVAKARATLTAAGVTPAIDEAYQPGGKDYGGLAQRIADAGACVVYIGGTYVEAGLIVRALRAAGSEAQLIGGDSLATDDFWNIAKETGEGTLMTFAPDPQKLDSARTVVQRFTDAGYNPEGGRGYRPTLMLDRASIIEEHDRHARLLRPDQMRPRQSL